LIETIEWLIKRGEQTDETANQIALRGGIFSLLYGKVSGRGDVARSGAAGKTNKRLMGEMMKLRNTLLCGVAFSACVGVASNAADEAAPAAPALEGQRFEEIVVTARRRSEALQDVPISIQAFNQDQLWAASISTAMDLQTRVPGLTVAAGAGNPGQPQFAIRGRGLNYGAASGAVETYFADVPLSPPFGQPTLPPQFFDLQNLQILKGPQGTLFGRSTTGGAVLLVPAAPSDQFGGYARVQGGNYGNVQLEGAINLPLVKGRADLRLAGFYWHRDGYSRTFGGNIQANTGPGTGVPAIILPAQDYNNQDVQEFRATLLLTPTDQLTNSTIFTFHRDTNISSAGAGLFANAFGQIPGVPLNAAVPASGYNTLRSATDMPLGGNPPQEIWAIINTTTFGITDNLALKNIFGYINSAGPGNNGTDADGSTASTIDLWGLPRSLRNYQTTNEIQLQGHNFNNRFEWILGGLLDRSREPRGPNDINYGGLRPVAGGWSATFAGNDITSHGLFGSATFKLTDRVSVTAGYRRAWNTIEQTLASGATTIAQGFPLGYTPGREMDFSVKQPGNAYNFGVEYKPKDNLLLYTGYRRGFKYGGFNALAIGASSPLASFQPETVDDFYAGVKSDFKFAGMPARFNIEGYWDLYHNQQNSYLSLVGTELSTVTVNIPGTTYRGFDLDFTVDPKPWVTVNFNYSYTDGYITNYIDQSCVATNCGVPSQHLDLSVNPVQYVSPNKFLLSARFHTELPANRGGIAFAPTLTYQGTFYGPYARLAPQAQSVIFGQNFNQMAHGGDTTPHYMLLNLRAEWNGVLGSKIDAALNVTNVFDKIYQLGNSTTLNYGVEGIAYGPPRMATFELSTRF
jgi:iron complex outermembrane receptor protein